jgi:hypothetical protein
MIASESAPDTAVAEKKAIGEVKKSDFRLCIETEY